MPGLRRRPWRHRPPDRPNGPAQPVPAGPVALVPHHSLHRPRVCPRQVLQVQLRAMRFRAPRGPACPAPTWPMTRAPVPARWRPPWWPVAVIASTPAPHARPEPVRGPPASARPRQDARHRPRRIVRTSPRPTNPADLLHNLPAYHRSRQLPGRHRIPGRLRPLNRFLLLRRHHLTSGRPHSRRPGSHHPSSARRLPRRYLPSSRGTDTRARRATSTARPAGRPVLPGAMTRPPFPLTL